MSDTLAAHIASTPFAPYAAELLEHARPAIRLEPIDPDPAGAVGRSRFGGLPDVGPDFEWPKHRRHLAFLLQVDLASLRRLPAAAALPPDGLLSFFYDATGQPWGFEREHQRGFRVVYTPASVPLHALDRPAKGMSPELLLPAADMVTTHRDTLPAQLPIWPDEFDVDDLDGDGVDFDPEETYLLQVLGDSRTHQLLGYPHPIQNDIYGVASDPTGPWVSLLELDSDPRLGTMWGDSGKLHWVMPRVDLAEGRFDRVHGELQCC